MNVLVILALLMFAMYIGGAGPKTLLVCGVGVVALLGARHRSTAPHSVSEEDPPTEYYKALEEFFGKARPQCLLDERKGFNQDTCVENTRSGRWCARTSNDCNIPFSPASTPTLAVERSSFSYDPEVAAEVQVVLRRAANSDKLGEYCVTVDALRAFLEDGECAEVLTRAEKTELRDVIKKAEREKRVRAQEVAGTTFRGKVAHWGLRKIAPKMKEYIESKSQ